jgi:hypothetical protein
MARACWLAAASNRKHTLILSTSPPSLVGNSPTLSGESGKTWFIWFRVQPLSG